MDKYYPWIVSLLLLAGSASAQSDVGMLSGIVTDDEGEPVISGLVSLYRDGSLYSGVRTDFHGRYAIKGISPGIYDLEVSYVGYRTLRETSVYIGNLEHKALDLVMTTGVNLDEIENFSCVLVRLIDSTRSPDDEPDANGSLPPTGGGGDVSSRPHPPAEVKAKEESTGGRPDSLRNGLQTGTKFNPQACGNANH